LKKNTQGDGLEEAVKAGVINYDEAALVQAAIAVRKEVVRVDDFKTDQWKEEHKNVLKVLSYN
jgi:hypothetical protein